MAGRQFGSYAASGIVVLVAAGFLGFALISTAPDRGGHIDLVGNFSSSDGLAVGSPVQTGGVEVGTVKRITLDPKTYLAKVVFSVSRRIPFATDSSLSVTSAGASSAATLSIEPGTATEKLHDGQTVDRTSPADNLEHDIGIYIFGNGGLAGGN